MEGRYEGTDEAKFSNNKLLSQSYRYVSNAQINYLEILVYFLSTLP